MELSEFITSSLIGIRNGLHEANSQIAKSEGKVLGENASALFVMAPGKGNAISFDVAVTVNNEGKDLKKGGGGINISVVNMGGEIGKENKNSREYASRIKFDIYPNLNFG